MCLNSRQYVTVNYGVMVVNTVAADVRVVLGW